MKSVVDTDWPHQGLAVITVSDTDTPNHNVTWDTVNRIADALEGARVAGARVTILASGIDGYWLNHAHLDDLRAISLPGAPERDSSGWFRAPRELSRTEVVSIAAISGDTSGGGCELGWACDLRIAETGVRFSQPEVIIGVGTGIGGTSRLRRLIGRTATAEMTLMGLPMSPERLYELGGINRVVARGQALKTAIEWGRHLASMPPAALAAMKRMLTEGEDLSLTAALKNDQRISQTLFRSEEGLERMRIIQDRYNRGETIPKVLWEDPPPV